MMRRTCTSLLIAVVLAGAPACSTDPLGEPILTATSITIGGAPADSVMLIGANRNLTATVLGPDGTPLEDEEVTWSSSDQAVATVNADGRVTAVAAGEAEIRASSGEITRAVGISVRESTSVPNGGTRVATMLNSRLRLSIPNSVAPQGTVIHARMAVTWPANTRIVPGTVVEIGPPGYELASNITAGVTFVPADIPAVERPLLRLFAVQANGTWAELPSASVDLTNFRVNAGMSRLTKIAIFRAATP